MLDEHKKSADIVLSRPLSVLLIDLLRAVGAGDAVMVMPLAKQLTTQEAADVLNVSRPFLIKLLEEKKMAYEKVGRHRRVLAKDVFNYKQAQIQQRGQALSELAASDADLIWYVFANRYVAVIDACSLVSALGRNTLLSLADADLYRVRWSGEILDETERALESLFTERKIPNAAEFANTQRLRMETAFPEARIDQRELSPSISDQLPDSKDAHVIATALACDASVIVTENIKHFPNEILGPLNIESKRADDFIADTIDLYPARALEALATMRKRFNKPEISPEKLLLKYESNRFIQTADLLRPNIATL